MFLRGRKYILTADLEGQSVMTEKGKETVHGHKINAGKADRSRDKKL